MKIRWPGRARDWRALAGVPLMALGMALLTACGGAPKTQSLTVTVNATETVNPDMQGRPSPIVLHVYELRSGDQFSGLDYFSLTNEAQGALSGDLLGQQQHVMTPGGNRVLELELSPQTAALGFVAGYRDMDNAIWRKVVPVGEKTKAIEVTLDQQQLDATASD